jgi:hypothetical protein
LSPAIKSQSCQIMVPNTENGLDHMSRSQIFANEKLRGSEKLTIRYPAYSYVFF